MDGVRAESAAGVKTGALRAFWTRVARSRLASGEREAESVQQPRLFWVDGLGFV